MESEDDQYLSVFDIDIDIDIDTKQIVFPDNLWITNLVKWVCKHCTIAVSRAHRTF